MKFHRHPNKFVNHLHLKVSNMEESLEFYQNILGLHVIKKQSNFAELSPGGKVSLVTLEQVKKPKPLNRRNIGLFHIAFLLPQRDDLATFIRHLIEMNYPIQGASDHLVSEALYLSDPD